ncbi:hypothetical protein GTY75_19000 [Streptomyces sp. SID8381]|uniref:hypothetical protein n=1 Tax=unclassified Streptomyces TaxID=2593676 RepID=UPI00039C905B|nr:MULTISPECIES: hypothetical protein [unclassified Streptomyces]MYX28707.1 hypothetical protein [Streptomyces sp. SID8381]
MPAPARAADDIAVTGNSAATGDAAATTPAPASAAPAPASAAVASAAAGALDTADNAPLPAPSCADGCEVCAEAADEFSALRAESLAQRNRFAASGHTPYAAEKQTLHRGDCKKVEQSVGRVTGDGLAAGAEALSRFAHDGRLRPEWATHVRLLETGEAAQWVKERIGPRGGARYRLCRTCTPELP